MSRISTRAAAVLGLLVLVSTALTVPADGAGVSGPGRLDPAFGDAGIVTTGFPNPAVGASAVGVQGTDGGFVVAGGGISGSAPDFLLARYHASGALDTRFGVGGRVVTTLPAGPGAQGATALAVDSRWRVVVVGTAGLAATEPTNGYAVARYLPDGSLDRSFGSGGITVFPVGPIDDGAATAVAIQPDGRIVVAGGATDAANNADFAVARLRADGTLDSSFGHGGRMLVDLGGDAQASAVAVQPDGKIVLAGTAVDAASVAQFGVVRLTADGVLDDGFGVHGIVLQPSSAGQSIGGASAVLADPVGRLILAGTGQTPAGQTGFALMRLSPQGMLDGAFGAGGKVLTLFTGIAGASSVLLRHDGGLVAVGSAGHPSRIALAGYRADGTLDPAFGDCGRTTTGTSRNAAAVAAAFQLGTRILVAGTDFDDTATAGRFLLARYQGYPAAHHGYGPPSARGC